MLKRTALVLGFVGSLTAPAFADTITYKNGHQESGRLVEERENEVVFEVSKGRIVIPKKEIALFIENEDYGDRYRAAPKRASGEATPGGETNSGGKSWRVPKDASADERRDLQGAHARLAEELAKLGASDEERRQRLELTGTDRSAAESAAQRLGQPGAQGATAADFAPYGIKAIPILADVLATGSTAAKAEAANALADAVTRGDEKDARWLLGKNKVASRLGALLDASGDETAANARTAANHALDTISAGAQVGWSDSKDSFPSPAQAAAIQKWKDWISKDTKAFDAAQKETDDARRALEDTWKSLEDPKKWRTNLSASIDKYGIAQTDKGTGDKGTGDKGTGDKTPEKPLNAEVAKDASPEEQKQISELRSQIKKFLEKTIGPSVEERKKKYRDLLAQDPDAGGIIDEAIFHLNEHGRARHTEKITRRDNSEDIRRAAIATLVGYGLKGLEKIAENALASDQALTRWAASTASAQIYGGASDKDDAVVLFGAYDVATKILPVIEGAEEENSGHMRSDGNKALEAITGQSVGWPDNDQKDLTQEEIDAKAKWGAIVSQQASEFKRREEAREKARKKLTELLKNLDKKDAWKDALVEAPKVMKDAERDLGKH